MEVPDVTMPLSDHPARLLVRQVVTSSFFFDLPQLLRERVLQDFYKVFKPKELYTQFQG